MKIEGWADIKQRFIAWYEYDIVDRMPIIIKRNNMHHLPAIKKAPCNFDHENNCWDVDLQIKKLTDQISSVKYYGEALPYYRIGYGNVFFALFWGCTAKYSSEGQLWLEECVDSWNSFPEFIIQENSLYYKASHKLIETLSKKNNGEYFVSPAWSNGCGDILAALRGTQKLLEDLYDFPEQVKRRVNSIKNLWPKIMDSYFQLISPYQEGHINWFDLWAPGKNTLIGCDFAALISPEHFEKIFLSEIEYQCKYLDYPMYHLDGSGQIPHIDMLLDIHELKGIQWQNDDLTENAQLKKIPLFKKILSRRKCLTLKANPAEVETLVECLGKNGLLLRVNVDTEEEVKYLLKTVS